MENHAVVLGEPQGIIHVCWGEVIIQGTHVMFISTLTPGAPLSVFMIAMVEITSTRVAVRPPCSVPPRLVCSSSTRISHTTLPGLAAKMST